MATATPDDEPNTGLQAIIVALASGGLVTPPALSPSVWVIAVIILVVVLTLGVAGDWRRRPRPCQH